MLAVLAGPSSYVELGTADIARDMNEVYKVFHKLHSRTFGCLAGTFSMLTCVGKVQSGTVSAYFGAANRFLLEFENRTRQHPTLFTLLHMSSRSRANSSNTLM